VSGCRHKASLCPRLNRRCVLGDAVIPDGPELAMKFAQRRPNSRAKTPGLLARPAGDLFNLRIRVS